MAIHRSRKARELARNQDCTLRLVGICNFNNSTTVACHVGKNRGMGIKCGDNMTVFACSSCHDAIDGRSSHDYDSGELAKDILRALEETQELMLDSGVMVVS